MFPLLCQIVYVLSTPPNQHHSLLKGILIIYDEPPIRYSKGNHSLLLELIISY